MVNEALRHARVAAGLSQAEMGKRLGLTMAGYRQKKSVSEKLLLRKAEKWQIYLGKAWTKFFTPHSINLIEDFSPSIPPALKGGVKT